MKIELPPDVPLPELEYLDLAWRMRCACQEKCSDPLPLASGCEHLKKEVEQLAKDVRVAYRAYPAKLNHEYRRLCGFQWGASLVEQRCTILANLGARESELTLFGFIGITLMLSLAVFALLKKIEHVQASLAVLLTRLAPVVVTSIALSFFGSYVSTRLGGASQFVAMFLSIPIAALAFCFAYRKDFRSRLLLGGFALVFATLSNFWIASMITLRFNHSISVNASDWTLRESKAMNERIERLLFQ
jgi:drug/metabolite transporter (DMT)-like permease